MKREFDGVTYDPALDRDRLKRQLCRIYWAMADGGWRTLYDLRISTGDPEASISARLRDLRKPRWGGYVIERRRATHGQWEYRMTGKRTDKTENQSTQLRLL